MKKERRIRGKTFLFVAALVAAGFAYVQLAPGLDDSMYRTILAMLCVLLFLLWIPTWVLFVSGLRWKRRLIVFVLLVGVGLGLSSMLRLEGFEGDILPQFRWAWEPRPGEVYDELEMVAVPKWDELPGAADSLAFLGADGANEYAAEALPAGWTGTAPTERWRRKVGLGWSSFAVARALAITQEQRGDEEYIVAYALDDGAAIWTHHNQARFAEPMGGDGPRATPTIAGERVLALGATGILDCLDLTTGTLHWSRETLDENGHANLEWGKSGSPLVVGGLVIVTLGEGPGGSLAAYDVATGEARWRAGEYNASYASPVLRMVDGVEQLVVVYADHLAGHEVQSGEMLWSTEIPEAAANVANPVVLSPNRVLVTIGYGKGARLFEVTRTDDGAWGVEVLWRSMAMKTKFTNVVVRGELAFGLDEGRLACIDLATGRRTWKGSRWGHGQLLGAGPYLLLQAEDGEFAILEASADGENVLQRFDVLDSKTWNQPVLAGRFLLVRNDREAACYAWPTP